MPHAAAADGTPIRYSLEGPEGAPVLMLSNSLGTALEMWDDQRPLAGARRLLRYDPRGHGRSGVPAGEYSLYELGRDALAVLDAAGVERTAFCGISMGGAVGQWLAVNAPHRLDRLVLANTAAAFGTPESWAQRIETVARDGMGPLAPVIIDRWFTPGFRARAPAAVARIEAMLRACPPAGYVGCCAALREIDLRGELGAIATPTLVIAGAHDPATPPDAARQLASAIAGARLAELDAAHLSNIEQAAAFNAALAAFLG
jgi:3-oxoadipate enol-lactonase